MSDPLPGPAKPRPGANTPEGLERCRKATWRHGRRDAEAIAAQRLRGEARRLTAGIHELVRQAEARGLTPSGGASQRLDR